MSKIDLYLMGEKGLRALHAMLTALDSSYISAVVSSRDSGVRNDFFAEIAALAGERGIPFHHRTGLAESAADCAMAVGWRWLIHRDYSRLIVLHDSLLPRYRGFNPLVSCLLNAEPEIGVTALIAGEEYDRGPIMAQARTKVRYPISIQAAIEALLPLYETLAADMAARLCHGLMDEGTAQDESQATYSLWRDADDYRIDWSWDAVYIHRCVLALGPPYEGAQTHDRGRSLRITAAEPLADVRIENRAPGKVIFMKDGIPDIVCGKGLLRILEAHYDDDNSPVLPLDRFRVRLGNS